MLGFDALGRLALGQVSNDVAASYTIAASVGAFALSGQAALFKVNQPSAIGSFTLSGQAALFKATLTSGVGSFALSGQAATFPITFPAAAGAYLLNGQAAAFKTTLTSAVGSFALAGQSVILNTGMVSGAGSYLLTGQAATFPLVWSLVQGAFAVTFNDAGLIRTGDDTEQVYGGVGHYLEALREARKREAITRKPPQPFVTRPPALRPYTPQQPAQMPEWSVLANPDAIMAQQQQAAIAQQQAAQLEQRKRREAQDLELLLLAA